jgi:hypothetical protein
VQKEEMLELAELVATSVVKALKQEGVVGKADTSSANKKTEKTAYQKCEQLLYNYKGFKRIVEERLEEIEEIKKYGVRHGCGAKERVQGGKLPGDFVLPDESVENAVHRIHCAISLTVQVIDMIDSCMAALKNDPYYNVLEMRYFENRTLEEIAVYFNCDTSTISRNRSRLVKEMALRLFPDDVVSEYIN